MDGQLSSRQDYLGTSSASQLRKNTATGQRVVKEKSASRA